MIGQCLCGIDPGLGGAIAFYYPYYDRISAEDMPVVGGSVDVASLSERIKQIRPDMAYVELVGARPGQGVSSMFSFGKSFGMVLGVLAACGVPYQLVSPQKWKKHFGLIGADKDQSRVVSLRYWPSRSELFRRKKDHGRGDAALLARYAFEKNLYQSEG